MRRRLGVRSARPLRGVLARWFAAPPSPPSTVKGPAPEGNGGWAAPGLGFLSHPEHLLEKVDSTIATCEALLGAIPAAPTPQAKHDLIDSTSNVLCLLLDPCEFVRQIHPDERYKRGASLAFQKGYEYMSTVNSRQDLYEVIRSLDSAEGRQGLDEESIKNVVQLKRDMESNGIHLPDAERARVVAMNVRKEELSMRCLTDEAAASTFLADLLGCRHDLARLLGFDCYAEQQLRGTILQTPANVWRFLGGLSHRCRTGAESEMALLRRTFSELRDGGDVPAEWIAQATAVLRHNAEPAGLQEYFSVANCIRGIQCLCSEVFGVHLVEVEFLPEEVLSAEAKKYHVYDAEKSFLGVIVLDLYASPTKYCQAGHLTLQLGCTPHAEALARVGLKFPPRQYPVVVLTCNVGSSRPAERRADGGYDDEKTLIPPNEVTTLFHEFGHAMHTIFGQTRVHNLAGTRSSIDFVETFSQLFEQFLSSYDFLRLWAHHFQTHEPISREIVHQHNTAMGLFTNLGTLDSVMLSVVDQVLHGPKPLALYHPQTNPGGGWGLHKRTLGDFADYHRDSFNLGKLLMETTKPFAAAKMSEQGALNTLSFEHLSGYPAGYYGYLYSLGVARRIWKKNFEHNAVNREAGEELVRKVMRFGAACDPAKTLEDYLGEDLVDVDRWE
ncbi:unnamed protein product [Phytomonas sp. Hart1]|nr:unnamed protein product [Phytomonas sp. Hart1]|eukprot:CCW69875.1 unnamed protein product [Phytomonas sp. isolate Hart1]